MYNLILQRARILERLSFYHQSVDWENRSTHLLGNKKHMRVKSYQFTELVANFSL